MSENVSVAQPLMELISKIAGVVMDFFLIQASFLLGFYISKGLMSVFSA